MQETMFRIAMVVLAMALPVAVSIAFSVVLPQFNISVLDLGLGYSGSNHPVGAPLFGPTGGGHGIH